MLQKSTKLLTFICGLVFLFVLFLPIWKIELTAPQYPEGLELLIFSGKLGGKVDIINGLNHYIGMRELRAGDFIEFRLLPYLIGLISLFGILTSIINRKWFFFTWAVIFFSFAILSMVDFYAWLYNYGHNLNPEAPIKVPGMSYQPPMFGYKQLLNFEAFSIPDIGGWIMFGVGLVLLFLVFTEIKKKKNEPV